MICIYYVLWPTKWHYVLFKEPLVIIRSILLSLVIPISPSSKALLLATSVSALNEYGSQHDKSAKVFLFNKILLRVKPSLKVLISILCWLHAASILVSHNWKKCGHCKENKIEIEIWEYFTFFMSSSLSFLAFVA